MKIILPIIFILIVFSKTGNVLSEDNIFYVNNIEIEKKPKLSNQELSNNAIKKGFEELVQKILLKDDIKLLSSLKFSQIKDLVSYYQLTGSKNNNKNEDKVIFNLSFDKVKLHDLFYKKGISYSEIIDKEVYLLPIFKKDDQIFIYNNNYFYENWNKVNENGLIEFILPLENIEILQNINSNKNNLLDIEIRNIFKEYNDKNLALVLIESSNSNEQKVFLRSLIQGKKIDKILIIERKDYKKEEFLIRIIKDVSEEIINVVKSKNLIDVRTPSFLNTRLILKDNNLVELNKRLANIDLIDNVYVQELNNEYILIKLKYYGKINKIIDQLKNQKIILKLVNDQWKIDLI